MNEKLKNAILNNNDLYEAVFNAQNIGFERNNEIWYSLEKTPPLYSSLVTVSEKWQPDEIFALIDDRFKRENWTEWSIKDSFAARDLRNYGFEKLFDAQWFYLEAAKFAPFDSFLEIEYKIVRDEKLLDDWRLAWDSNEHLGKMIFQSAMLGNPQIYFLAGCRDEKFVSGCLINKTADVFGISNFFAPEPKIEYWSAIIRFVHESIKLANIVGYEKKGFVNKLQPLGFEAVGDLTVWLRSNASG